MTLGIVFDRFGPYHIARISAANKYIPSIGIEIFGKTTTYAWEKVDHKNNFDRITIFPNKTSNEVSISEIKRNIYKSLNKIKLNVIAINGYHNPAALVLLLWALENNVSVILMSESTFIDRKRWKLVEYTKKNILNLFDAAIVGGSPHVDYLKDLGFNKNKILTGYDVVDNEYFNEKTEYYRFEGEKIKKEKGLPDKYFLTSCRFIPKKNIPFMLTSYANYIKIKKEKAFGLVLLGSGPQEELIKNMIKNLGIKHKVFLPGFKQYDELPIYYAFAKAFILPSKVEQWGLVVNEAMASGLPVIVSRNCGSSYDLVKNGKNGFLFDPTNEEELISILNWCTENEDKLQNMGEKSKAIIRSWSPELFGSNIKKAAEIALSTNKRKSYGLLKKLLIESVSRINYYYGQN